MNIPWRGGFLFLLLAAQDPAPARPDLVATYAAILDKGPDARRDLAARALLSLGRPGYDALKRAIAAKPELAKSVPAPGDVSPAVALVRIAPFGSEAKQVQAAINAPKGLEGFDEAIPGYGTVAEPFLWTALESSEADRSSRAARHLRRLYAHPDGGLPGRPSTRLAEELNRKRDFDLADRSLADVLKGESLSWILMSPRDERITLRLKGVTLSDVLRISLSKFAAVPVGDLLVIIPPERIASVEPGGAVWAPSDLAPRIEAALDALARDDGGPINGLTGVGVYHALKRAGAGGEKFSAKAGHVFKQLQQRIFFVDVPGDDGPLVTLAPATTAPATVAAFEKASGIKIEIADPARLEGSTIAFNFRGVPAKLAARALAFRLNRIF